MSTVTQIQHDASPTVKLTATQSKARPAVTAHTELTDYRPYNN